MGSSLCVQESWQASALQGIVCFGEVSGFYRLRLYKCCPNSASTSCWELCNNGAARPAERCVWEKSLVAWLLLLQFLLS